MNVSGSVCNISLCMVIVFNTIHVNPLQPLNVSVSTNTLLTPRWNLNEQKMTFICSRLWECWPTHTHTKMQLHESLTAINFGTPNACEKLSFLLFRHFFDDPEAQQLNTFTALFYSQVWEKVCLRGCRLLCKWKNWYKWNKGATWGPVGMPWGLVKEEHFKTPLQLWLGHFYIKQVKHVIDCRPSQL